MNKVIHYFWFGKKEKPQIFKTCLKSWKKYLPEWEIKEWNETNVDIYINDFTKKAYENDKWAFVSDYFRCYILEKYGGLYLDVDCEIIKSPEVLFRLDEPVLGFEFSNYVAAGLIMYFPKPHHPLLLEMIKSMEEYGLINEDITSVTVVTRFTDILKDKGLVMNGYEQFVGDVHIYPSEYFCPINPTWHRQTFTKNTFIIHHYLGSWYFGKELTIIKFKRLFFRLLHPLNCFKLLKARYF